MEKAVSSPSRRRRRPAPGGRSGRGTGSASPTPEKNAFLSFLAGKKLKMTRQREAVVEEIFDLFCELDASDEQADFPILYAIGKDGVPRGKTRLRKNPGANIMAEGASPIDGIAPGPHRIRVAKIGARILLEVDGELAFDWTDPGKDGIAPYGRGQIGLRQMQHTVEGSYGYFRVRAIE